MALRDEHVSREVDSRMNKTLTVPIVGMHCASCAVNIQRGLRKAAGVVAAEYQ